MIHSSKHSYIRIAILTSLACTAMLGCSRGSQHTIHEPTKLVELTQSIEVLHPVFKTDANTGGLAKTDPLKLQAFYDDEYVFVASRKGKVQAMLPNGKNLWSVDIDDEITSGVSYDKASRTVVISSHDAKVIALDSRTGGIKWEQQLTGTVLAPAIISQNRVLLSANDGVVYGLDLDTGDRVWQASTPVPDISIRGTAAPVLIDKDTVLFAGADGRIYALNVQTGTPLWSKTVGMATGASDIERMNDIEGAPVLSNGYLYLTSYSGQLVAINSSTGKTAFMKKIPSVHSPAVSNDLVVVNNLEGEVVAFDNKTGVLKWHNANLKYRQLTNPVAVGNYIAVGDLDGVLHLIEQNSGQIVSRHTTGDSLSHLQVVGNKLLSYAKSGEITVWQW